VNTLVVDESARAPESSGTEWASSEQAALFVFLLAEAVAFVFYAVVSRPMWFYLDEWDFLADRTAWNIHDLFRAHNEHWVTLPVLVYRGLWWVFGLNSYRPYQFVIILLHLIAALLVRTVMRRIGVRPWTATVVAGVLVFFGSGYQNIVLPFQITLVGSLVFGLVHLLLATHDGPLDRRDWFGLAAGLVLSAFTTRLLPALIPVKHRYDPQTFFLVVPILLAVTLLAAFIPARRAARVDPTTALRGD